MSIYKECDIRGIFEEEFQASEGYKIGRAVGHLHPGTVLAVAGDVRLSTPILKNRLIHGLLREKIHVVDLGVIPTPAFYHALDVMGVDGGIMVTASHNPARYNGFKLMFGEEPIAPEEIRKIESLVHGGFFNDSESEDRGNGLWEISGEEEGYGQADVMPAYRAFIQSHFPPGKKHLKIVLDCCDGTTSRFTPDLIEELGYEVVRLYCGTDGTFPNRNPNPALYNCLEDLGKKVIETGADLGAGYDGDGDRVVFVDNLGRVIQSENSFVIFIRDYLAAIQEGKKLTNANGQELTPTFVYDQKSMMIVPRTIESLGGIGIMEKSGYGFIKKSFLNHSSIMGGEISGHFFFGEIGKDDGLFATLKMCEILERSDKTLGELAEEIPPSYISPELRIFCAYEEQDALLGKARRMAEKYRLNELDGVRIEFPFGWFLFRKSVTEQAMTMRLEADSPGHLEQMKGEIRRYVPEVEAHPYFRTAAETAKNETDDHR